MKITSVNVRKTEREGSRMKGNATVLIDDCFAVHDIKVIEGNQGLCVAMPSRKTPEGNFKDIVHPLDTNTREEITKLVLAEYDKVLSESEGAETSAE